MTPAPQRHYLGDNHLLADGVDEEAGEWHDEALGHAPGRLHHHEVRVGEVWGAVLPHVAAK